MTEELRRLYTVPESEWAKLWCQLNKWELPDILFPEREPWFDIDLSQKNMTLHMNLIRPIMKHIKNTIGEKALSREWNRDSMTDEQHQFFWTHPWDEYYDKYHNPKIKT